MNGDGSRNGADIPAFVGCVIQGGSCVCADVNGMNGVTLADVTVFVADLLAGTAHFLETEEPLWVYRKPLNIDVRGDVAIVLYVVDFARRSRVNGAQTTGKFNWTEVFVRDGGAWKALTDHGTEVGGN